jgi:hypothetical protein
VRTVRVPPARLDGLGRGHVVRVTGRGAATSVVRTSPGRARSVSFRATVAGTRRGRPLLRLAPGASVVGPRTRDRAYARGDAVRVTWRLDRRTGSVRHVAVVRVAGGAPSSLAVQAAAARSVVFADEFGAAAGTPADPAKWLLRGEVCDDFTSHSCPRNANVFHDGAGNLVLRARREPAGWLGGGPYSGAFLGTFAYGSGWPPRKVTASWSVPYRIEMRALMPAGAGLWAAAWDMSVDRTQRQGPWELDWAEARLGDPTRAGCYQHRWVNGVDVAPWAGGLTVTDMTRNWHVYSADVSADRVEYRVDGVLCGVAPGVRGRFGLLLDLVVGAPGSWGSGGGQPSPDDPGPWDLKIDHVRVTR